MSDSTDLKPCPKCGMDKSDFPYGRKECRDCQNEYRRRSHAARPEVRRKNNHKWKTENPDKVRKGEQRRRKANPGHARALGRAQYAANPEKNRARKRAWVDANPDKLDAKRRRERARQHQTRVIAERRNYTWAGWELELLADESRKANDLALQLGRTLAAVYTMRYCIRHDPKTITRAGLSESGRV